uniref:Uncharacterized protein n=1 Tax=Vitrella brassicaformis TaxID=1169539 RepID=A0A7S1JL31_9ALVE
MDSQLFDPEIFIGQPDQEPPHAVYNFGKALMPVDTRFLCWCPTGCTEAWQFGNWKASAGTLTIKGPHTSQPTVACTVGNPCNVTLTGIGLDSGGVLAVTKGSADVDSANCRSLPVQDLFQSEGPAEATSDTEPWDTYSLGIPTKKSDHYLCWRHTSSQEGDDKGYIRVGKLSIGQEQDSEGEGYPVAHIQTDGTDGTDSTYGTDDDSDVPTGDNGDDDGADDDNDPNATDNPRTLDERTAGAVTGHPVCMLLLAALTTTILA